MEAGGSAGTILILVNNGAEINALNNDGETALHAAVFMYAFAAKGMEMAGGDTSGPLKGIEALVESGADVNLLSRKGKTPLDNAMPVVVPGLIDPPPGGVENLPSVKYLRSKGGRTAEELKTKSPTKGRPAGRLSTPAEQSGSTAKDIKADVVAPHVSPTPSAVEPSERRRRIAFRLPSGDDEVLNINVSPAQQLTNLNSITTNAAERALIEETLLGPRRLGHLYVDRRVRDS